VRHIGLRAVNVTETKRLFGTSVQILKGKAVRRDDRELLILHRKIQEVERLREEIERLERLVALLKKQHSSEKLH
jgi:hypothetical protein